MPVGFIAYGFFVFYHNLMNEYIKRLMRCGYSRQRAEKVCIDFMLNLPIFDLEFFVWSVEKNVGQISAYFHT